MNRAWVRKKSPLVNESPNPFFQGEKDLSTLRTTAVVSYEYPDYTFIVYAEDILGSGLKRDQVYFIIFEGYIVFYVVAKGVNFPNLVSEGYPYIPKTFRCQGVIEVGNYAALLDYIYQNGLYYLNPFNYDLAYQVSTKAILEENCGRFGWDIDDLPWNQGTSFDQLKWWEEALKLAYAHDYRPVIYELLEKEVHGAEVIEGDPSWFPGEFPKTPFFHMVFYSGHSWYIPDGMVINQNLMWAHQSKGDLVWIYCTPETDILGYINVALPARNIVAYGKGVEYKAPKSSPVIYGHVIKYYHTKASAVTMARGYSRLGSIPGLGYIGRVLQ